MAIEAFSNLSMIVSNGGTVPSIDYLFYKTYVNIGSGNVLKISWNAPTAANNLVDSYKIYILIYDPASASYQYLYNKNIGNVNEFYLKSTLLNTVSQSFMQLYMYVEAVSAYGAQYNGISNIEYVYVSRGCSSYINVEEGYTQPIMKRTLAFAKVDYVAFVDDSGVEITDDNGDIIYLKASSTQDDTNGWTLMQEFHTKDSNNIWKVSDASYEVLTDSNGEIITDQNNDIVYLL